MSSGLWYRTLVYLGLKEEPEEGYDDLPERNANGDADGDGRGFGDGRYDEVGFDAASDRLDAVPDGDGSSDADARRGRRDATETTAESNVRPLRATDADHVADRDRLAVVDVEVFDDVERVGARYRAGQAVLFDVGGAERATGRRVVDFVAGLTYALHGRMHKVGTRAFLLVPDGVHLSDQEIRRLTTLGYRLPTGSDA